MSNDFLEHRRETMHYAMDTSGCPIECVPDLIRKRAYQLYERRGRMTGHELDDWLEAEREVTTHLGLKA